MSAKHIGKQCSLIAIIVLVLTIIPSPAFADTTTKRISCHFCDRLFEDISEIITLDKTKKDKLRFEHALAEQERVNADIKAGLEIAKDRFDRIKSKLEKIQDKTGNFIDEVRLLKEHNEIRQCVSDFAKLRNISGEQRSQLAKEIDDRCNNLKSTQKYCTARINSLEIADKENPYNHLQEICPKLKDYTTSRAYGLLYG